MSTLIYVDESGDLGWSFDQPYGQGGSSRYLSIAAMILPATSVHLPERKIRHLYTLGRWDTKREKKWVEMPSSTRTAFAECAVKLHETNSQIKYKAIVVDKRNVAASLRADSNKLYNYMLKLLLLEEMAKHAHITLIPDPRSIKVENGKSLPHYLEMMLYEVQASTQLEVISYDSRQCLNLQFVDMLAGVVGTHFEFNNSTLYRILNPHIEIKTLFFNG